MSVRNKQVEKTNDNLDGFIKHFEAEVNGILCDVFYNPLEKDSSKAYKSVPK